MLLTENELRAFIDSPGAERLINAIQEAEARKVAPAFEEWCRPVRAESLSSAFAAGAEWGIRKQEETFKLNGTPRVGKTTDPRFSAEAADLFRHSQPFNSGVHTIVPNRRAELLELFKVLMPIRNDPLEEFSINYNDESNPPQNQMRDALVEYYDGMAREALTVLDAVDRACDVGK